MEEGKNIKLYENNSSKQFTFCNLVFKDEMQMKKHMKTHLYALVQYKGDLCESGYGYGSGVWIWVMTKLIWICMQQNRNMELLLLRKVS
jgi:hypothetical protein